MPAWDSIREILKQFGFTKGLFILFFFMAHGWVYRLYSGRLADRQAEINRIAEDNREYRERFLAILDDHFGLKKGKRKKK